MKKLLAILLTLTFIVSAMPAFAAESAHEVTEFVNGTEYVYNSKTTGTKTYVVTASACKAGGFSTNVNSSTITVIQFPLPKLAPDQSIANYKIRVCDVKEDQNRGSSFIYLKLDNLDWNQVTGLNARTTDEPFATAMAEYDNSDYLADNGERTATLCPGYKFYYYTVDVTDYANECRAKGKNVMHIGVYSRSTRSIYANGDTGFAADDERIPYSYFTPGELGELKLVYTSAKEMSFDNDADEGIEFIYNNPINQAIVTANGVAAQCSIENNKVKVLGLENYRQYELRIDAKDIKNSEFSYTTCFFTGYAGYDYVKSNTYLVTSAGSTYSGYNPSSSPSQSVVFKIALPKLEKGKVLDSFKFRFLSPVSSGEQFDLFKLPGESWSMAELIMTSQEVPEGKINIYEYAINYDEYRADFGLKTSDTTNLEWADKDNGYLEASYADLTKYAKECIENGQTSMWLGVRSDSTSAILGVGNTTHAPNGRVHYYYWTVKDADQTASTPKVVLSTDEKVYADAVALSDLEKSNVYKFVTKLSNFEAEAKVVNLVLAKYSADNTIEEIAVKPVTLDAGATAVEVSSNSLAVGATDGYVKAFIIADDDSYPVVVTHTKLAVK